MPSARRMLACVAAALVASAQGVSVEVDVAASTHSLATDKFIAGVPVFNYDLAYSGRTHTGNAGSLSVLSDGEAVDTSAHKESWIVVLKEGSSGEEIQDMCLRTEGGCTHEGHHPRLPFVAVRATEEELAAAVEPARDIARYIDLDVTMSPDPPGEGEPADQQVRVEDVGNPYVWGLDRIGHSKRTTSGAGVHVYVLDTGIRTEHVDFGGRAVPFLDMFNDTHTGTKFCNESTAEVCAGDVYGHGTHCAGSIMGTTFGVAPQAVVYAAKVLSDQGPGSTAGIIYAMEMVVLHGNRPAIVSMSLGGGRNELYRDAVDLLVDDGITVVVAAGNDYTSACLKAPAFVPSAITVGATAYGDVRSGFSNFGTCVDIWAPGSFILSADGRGATIPNDASRNASGTSMACPHVAGAAALLLEADPGMTPSEILASMLSAASVNYITDLSPDDENLFLYVGSDGPEAPESPKSTDDWPTDEFFASCGLKGQTGPRGDYPVCMCTKRADRTPVNGTTCYDGDTLGCPIGAAMDELDAASDNNFTYWYFLWDCATCRCLESPPAPMQPEGWNPWVVAAFGAAGLIVCFVACYVCGILEKSPSTAGDVEIAEK